MAYHAVRRQLLAAQRLSLGAVAAPFGVATCGVGVYPWRILASMDFAGTIIPDIRIARSPHGDGGVGAARGESVPRTESRWRRFLAAVRRAESPFAEGGPPCPPQEASRVSEPPQRLRRGAVIRGAPSVTRHRTTRAGRRRRGGATVVSRLPAVYACSRTSCMRVTKARRRAAGAPERRVPPHSLRIFSLHCS